MSRSRLPLAELKRKLGQQPAPKRAVVVAAAEEDDASLLKVALAGVKILPASQQAELARAKPAPVPRPRAAEPKAEQARPKTQDEWIPEAWLREDAKPSASIASDFAAAFRGVRPITSKRVELETPKPRPLPLQYERDEKAALAESIYAPTSLDLHLEGGDELTHLARDVPRSVLRDLRRGRWVVQDQVDLHGCNRDEARDLLAASMGRWRKEGLRCVRVVHGKGRGSPGREPVLKKLVAGWLINYADVMAYCQARLAEGGAGALIVLLKASRTTSLL